MSITKHIKLHLQYIKTGFQSRMTYRLDFFLSIIAFFLHQLSAPVFVGVVYYAGGEFPGWNIYQVLLLQGVLNMIKGFSFMSFFIMAWVTERRIRRGTFDLLLVRPVNTLWLLIMESFDEEDLGQFLAGVVLTVFAMQYVELKGSLLLFLPLAFFGVLFYFSLALLRSAVSIIFVKADRLQEVVNLLNVFASYPQTIYSPRLKFLFNTFVPLLLAANYPASALLGFSMEGVYIAMISAIVLVAFSLYVWHTALRKYTSAGG